MRAKLALRDGDKNAAAAAYAKAAQAFPQTEDWGYRRTTDWAYETVQPKCRVEGESAILALQRGEYLQAFVQLYRSNDVYWFDAAAVAERVLTVDELKQYVDETVPAPAVLTQEERENYVPLSVAAKLRNLLADVCCAKDITRRRSAIRQPRSATQGSSLCRAAAQG